MSKIFIVNDKKLVLAHFTKMMNSEGELKKFADKMTDTYPKMDALIDWVSENKENLIRKMTSYIEEDEPFYGYELSLYGMRELCDDCELLAEFESRWERGDWDEKLKEISIVAEDCRSKEAAKAYLATGTFVLPEDEVEDFIEEQAASGVDWSDLRDLLKTRKSDGERGVVERDGKVYLIIYCL